MSTTKSDEPSSEAEDQPDGETYELTPKISPKLALAPVHLALVAVPTVLFMLVNYLPLRPTDLWTHVLYGNWILEHGQLPAADPFMPLSANMPLLDSAWLSQILLALVERVGGGELLSTVFAIVVAATYVVLARTFYLQTGRVGLVVIGMLLALVVGWSRLTTFRPEWFGVFCFALLLYLVTWGQKREAGQEREADESDPGPAPWGLWAAVAVVFVLWTNLHGSFICGLAVVACAFAGRVIDVLWRTRSITKTARDPWVGRWLVAGEVAFVATLINPYGIDALLNALMFSSHANLGTILEWQPWMLSGVAGWSLAASLVLLILLWRHGRRPIPASHALMLALFGAATLLRIRMVSWYAPVFVLAVMPQLGELWQRILPARTNVELKPNGVPRGRSFHFSLFCIVLVWVGFALSPSSTPLLGGKPRSGSQLYGEVTPLGLTAYLRENPPEGLIYNPQWWGDWLVFDGPQGLQPFVTSQIHLVPAMVWGDYLRVSQGQAGWINVMDRYRVDAVVLDKSEHREQIRSVRRNEQWRMRYEDLQAAVFVRVEPAKAGPRDTEDTEDGQGDEGVGVEGEKNEAPAEP